MKHHICENCGTFYQLRQNEKLVGCPICGEFHIKSATSMAIIEHKERNCTPRVYANNDISAEEIKKLFHYNPETGVIKRIMPNGKVYPSRTNSKGKRRKYVKFNGKQYIAARVIWAYMTGEWPKLDIDHINGDHTDDRWINLRQALPHQNVANQKLKKNNKSGYKGVFFERRRKKWVAKLQINRRQFHLGEFHELKDAANAYANAAKNKLGEFARPETPCKNTARAIAVE